MSETRSQPDTSGAEPASAEEQTLEKLLAEAQSRLEEQKDAWMRAVAETDNARKRARVEVEAAHRFAVERFAESLLPVMDSLEAALLSKDVSGVEITSRQLKSALEKAGIREICPAAGERFDPYVHQAMAAVESANEPNTVLEVMQKGYLLHERTLRPALVIVAKALENKGGNPISEGTTNPN